MANSDYVKTGGGAFANALVLDAALDHLSVDIPFTRFRFAQPLTVGMVALVDDEIMSIAAIGTTSITVKRGCADTVPAPHVVNSLVWIFDSVGGDMKEWSAGETIGVKFSPYTGSGSVPMESVAPEAVTFNWRFTRPYPPAKLMVNGLRWFDHPTIDDTTPMLNLSWVHRDRVLQADQLIGHDDASVGPEPGVTYTLRIYDPISDTVVREEVGINGDSFTYQRAQATHDQRNPTEVLTPYYTLTSVRDGIESFQEYRGDFSLVPTFTLDSNYLAFEHRMFESFYVANAIKGLTFDANYSIGVAARPADRMSDSFDLIANGAYAQTSNYTPWLTLDVKLVELETIMNLRSSSLYDGVALPPTLVGKLALIDDEIVKVVRIIGDKQIEVLRGCCDTIPAQHIAGSRAWFFDGAHAFDGLARNVGTSVDYKTRPGVYGPAIPLNDLPTDTVTFTGRASLPYAPGRIVVNGRPWFEEVQATLGTAVAFSWARRNRVSQAAQIVSHVDADIAPEVGQVSRLRFYYVLPGPAQVLLRQIDVAGTSYSYSYANAQTDGDAAGRATGVCGTVVIYCEISAVRDGLKSFQSYVVPLRVPSYPC
jgi:hypothetical protein